LRLTIPRLLNPSDPGEKYFRVPRWPLATSHYVEHSRYTFQGKVVVELYAAVELHAAAFGSAGGRPVSFSHKLQAQEPIEVAGGQVQIVESSNFPIARTIAARPGETPRFPETFRRRKASNPPLTAS
jgi:hypothetical protein